MPTLRQIKRTIGIFFALLVTLWSAGAARGAITFTPGYIYSTLHWDLDSDPNGWWDIFEYSSSGRYLGSLTLSLPEGYNGELHGIAFGPDGLLYVTVVTQVGDSFVFRIIAVDSSGAVHATYTLNGVYIYYVDDGKIAIDRRYIYWAGGTTLVRFALGNPASGTVIYRDDDYLHDVKILPSGNLLIADDDYIKEITTAGAVVRTLVSVSLSGLDLFKAIEYDPGNNKLFVGQLGDSNSLYELLRINASTGAVEVGIPFSSPGDLFLTQSGTLLVGCLECDVPGIYSQDLNRVRTLGNAQRMFVTQYIPPKPVFAIPDFNGDHKTDIVWQNNVTGQRLVWLMDGTSRLSTVNLGTLSTHWTHSWDRRF